ncbi:uncharacterized protein LOC121903728 isoform X1 [Thunnus maccoyii]|uniref:uncharacterized protein LOC121903728 isoform X1 n=1 Tax=Thunnus maccoyii TaxID=8240 RepID=UPI001C4BBF9D|nr:uncharacterized protein LOC121903728 isoform X1 [Thunnus maccoyii]XP_042276989.1 uncharacterized protein LOC121903728 isoform X1 [Thunnus maccoyii]XP_042276990.1 uncharacterized protein LOC121903728 isoform X1 [Thunnus maccoyii]
MMDNPTANKSHLPCQSWAGQNGWSTASTQGPLLNPLSSSQHLSLGSSSDQRPPYDHMQASDQSCLSDLSTLSSRSNTHHPALYKASHISSNLSSTSLFANSAIPSVSHIISCDQQNPHSSSMLLAVNQGKNIPPPSLQQTNQGSQPCRPQHLPLLSPHDPYKTSFQPPLTNQGLQDMTISLPSCGQDLNHGSQRTSQPTFEGVNVDAGVAGYTHSHASSTSQEQPQWIPSSDCRGAKNKSVPDAAAHPNKKTSQKGNITPPASNERSRSVVLHQRALLLKQLSELDKLLESLPPDDRSDGQSQHTANQSPPLMNDSSQCEQTKTSDPQQVQLSAAGRTKSKLQSHLLADCSTSASCEEQNETCDSPDDLMSAAKLEKTKNVSAESDDSDPDASVESEDTDPDYSPNSDGDFSDCLSDTDDGFSDESSDSSPSTPQEETPHPKSPLPRKRGNKSGGSLLKDKSVGPLKKTHASNQKKSSTVVLPTSNSKAQRVYDKRNYCLFCSKPMVKMARHLESVHSDKAEVAAAFQYPKNSRERQKIWNRLKNQGNFAHNKNVLRTGKGQFVVRRTAKQTGKGLKDFLHCLYCRGLYFKRTLHRHMRLCPEKVKNDSESQIGRKRIASRCVLETIGDLGVSDGFRELLSQMTYNDVTQAVMDDKIILQFGEQMFDQHRSDVKRHDYIRQNLRQIARLLLEAQKITPLKKLEDFFHPSSFPHVVSAVNVLAGYDPEKKTYSIPSLAIKLGYHLQKCCGIVEKNAVQSGDTKLAESAQNFLSVYQKTWNMLVSSGALSTLRETKLNTEKKVPFSQDVKRLNFHMENVHVLAEKKLTEFPSAENYAALAKVILARTIIFNRRRAREVSAVSLTAFMSRKKSNLHDNFDISVSDLERTMCGFFTRIDIQGKCGGMVPVLLKPSFVSALELLVNVRETCGVPSKNLFLFGRPSALSAYNGSDCIQKYVKECGAKDPEALKSAKIRKHYATMLQLINLDENEADQIFGPNNQVRTLLQNSSMQLDDVQMDSEERLQPARGHQAASWDQSEVLGACYAPADFYHEQANGVMASTSMTVPPKYGYSGKKGSQNQGKHKWEDAEVCAVERHMMRFIQGHKVPQKNDCLQCLEAEPKALRTRSWKGVKDFVRNRITALKRQSGTSQALSTNSNWPGQVEPQRTGHFQQL